LANIKSAKKRAKQNIKKRDHNSKLRSTLRTMMKAVLTAINDKNKPNANEALKTAIPQIDKMTKKGLIHKNRGAKYKSSLNAKVKELG